MLALPSFWQTSDNLIEEEGVAFEQEANTPFIPAISAGVKQFCSVMAKDKSISNPGQKKFKNCWL